MSEPGKPARGRRELDALDAVFGALGHPARRHILQVLAARDGSMTAGELNARFTHSWPTTTRHLGVLVDAGLISVAMAGRERHYRLERQHLGDVLALWLRSVGFELLGPDGTAAG
ncbi:ArsR/SmtB family transcription factor [Nonomuraea sp. NPDC050790]|uniref:ArsR/SmtB family transcription factor n=1 Tax=Nonomuraea sp. NPDC050790 TaxID=3364371 RepID=UPI00379DA713